MKYDVHLYVTVRVKVSGVEAESQVAAIEKAQQEQWSEIHQLFGFEPRGGPIEECAFAEEIDCALVDEQGDEDFERSVLYEDKGDGWQPFLDNAKVEK